MLYEEGFTQNRELSWLRYNERVLEEALDDRVPLFERLRFIAIFDSNLEEFFKVRVGSLLGEDDGGSDEIDERSGMTAGEQLRQIHSLIPGLLLRKDMAYAAVEAKLAEAGIERLDPEQLGEEDRGRCFDFFRDEIRDRIGIRICSSGEAMPELDEERPYIIAELDAELEDRFGLIDIPEGLPKIFVLGRSEGTGDGAAEASEGISFRLRYVLTEDIISMFADTLFIPFVTLEVRTIDIARNAEWGPDAGRANTAGEMRRIVDIRKNAPADKLIADGKLGRNLKKYLCEGLGIDERQIFSTTRTDLGYINELAQLIPDASKKELMYRPHIPRDRSAELEDRYGSILEAVKNRDILSAYPFDSMDVFLNLLREASFTRNVKEIRITVYRLAENPKITDYLIYAARSGKKVRVVLELRARFDEERNLAWAEKLRAAGCRVYYGTDRYKVHSKLCQIVEENGAGETGYITQISTGNYNEKTAGQYTDLSLITADRKIGKAASRLFRDICRERIGAAQAEDLKKGGRAYGQLLVSPVNMRSGILRLIKREAEKGAYGRIFIKVNSLSDGEVIEALMEASCRGCQVRLIVRGICCMLPGIPGCTENVCIVNLVGRFLEHSRVYIFGEGADELMYISSADLMTRNMDRRVEVACPVRDSSARNRIRRIMHLVYIDTEKGRVMTPDGSLRKKAGRLRTDSQSVLSQQSGRSAD